MKRYGFDDSPVMRELERIEIAKNGADKAPIKKKASDDTDVLSKMFRLSTELRKAGRFKDAQSLDEKIAKYVTAENSGRHIYDTHGESGDDLIEFAHQDGDAEIAPSQNGYGKVETQLSQHKKIVDIVQKEPTGKYATASAMSKVAKMLGFVKKASVEAFKVSMNNAAQQMAAQIDNAPRFYLSKGTFTAPIISNEVATNGLWLDTIGGGAVAVISRGNPSKDVAQRGTLWNEYFYNWEKMWPGLYSMFKTWSGKGMSDAHLQTASINDFYKLHSGFDGQEKFKEMLQNSINEAKSIADSINDNLSLSQLQQLDQRLNNLKQNGFWKTFYINRDNQELTWINSSLEKASAQLKDLLKNSAKQELKNKANQLLISLKAAYNSNRFTNDQKDKLNQFIKQYESWANDIYNFNESYEALLGYIQIFASKNNKLSIIKMAEPPPDINIIRQLFPAAPPAAPAAAPAPAAPAAAPAAASAPAAPAGASAPARPAVRTPRVDVVADWKSKHDQAYWQAVDEMQRYILSIATKLSDFKSKVANIPEGTYEKLVGTGLPKYQGTFDVDGQWGAGTAKAVQAAKDLLSQLPEGKEKAKDIKTGLDKNVNGKIGYMHYAGTDADKQKEVKDIALENIKIMHEILNANGLGAGLPTGATGTGADGDLSTVYDNVPTNVAVWLSDAFLTSSSAPSAPLKKSDLANISNWDSWLLINDIIDDMAVSISMSAYQWKWYISRLLERAKTLAEETADDKKATAQQYVTDVEILYRKLLAAWTAFFKNNPDKKAATAAELEQALAGASSGASGTSSGAPGSAGSSVPGAPDAPSDGVDLNMNQRRQEDISNPITDKIFPQRLAQQYPNTNLREIANQLAPVIDIDDIRAINSQRPEELYRLIGVPQPDNWGKVLTDIGYNPSAGVVNLENGHPEAVRFDDGRHLTYRELQDIQRFRVAPPRTRVLNEWRLWKASEILDSLSTSIANINAEYGERMGNRSPNHVIKNNAKTVEWQSALSYASQRIQQRMLDFRSGRARVGGGGRSTMF